MLHLALATFMAIATTTFAAPAVSSTTASPSAATLSFDGREFLHRWSSRGQHEFTPQGEEDLSKWTTMITIVEHTAARDGDQLAALANGVLANYRKAGKILRTDSTPRTSEADAEHFIAAVLAAPALLEAVFARVMMSDGRGIVVVYSRRVYGQAAGHEMSAWLKSDAAAVEQKLRRWTGIPTAAALKALPTAATPAAPAPRR